MAQGDKKKTFDEYQKEIAALKVKRSAAWRKHVPDDVHDHGAAHGVKTARMAEAHPDVLAFDSQIRMLRAEQMEAHGDPTTDATEG